MESYDYVSVIKSRFTGVNFTQTNMSLFMALLLPPSYEQRTLRVSTLMHNKELNFLTISSQFSGKYKSLVPMQAYLALNAENYFLP